MSKYFILLQMYDILQKGGKLEIKACCEKFGFSVATYYRYIAFLRTYLKEEYGRELLFDSLEKNYSVK